MRLTAKQGTWLKVCLHLAGLLPFLWLAWAINHGGLGSPPLPRRRISARRSSPPAAAAAARRIHAPGSPHGRPDGGSRTAPARARSAASQKCRPHPKGTEPVRRRSPVGVPRPAGCSPSAGRTVQVKTPAPLSL